MKSTLRQAAPPAQEEAPPQAATHPTRPPAGNDESRRARPRRATALDAVARMLDGPQPEELLHFATSLLAAVDPRADDSMALDRGDA